MGLALRGSFANGKFLSSKQDWETPDELFRPLHREFRFTLDAAASATNKKVRRFYSAADDALDQAWAPHATWVNPPFGDPGSPLSRWVAKAADEASRGATVVMLVPARTNTNWFHDVCLAKGEVRFVRGRPKFSGAREGLPQPLMIVIFRPARH